jgi:CHAT domain-containing protein
VAARWRISDEATRAFMDVFYRTLLGGGSRLDAFAAAQRSLRHREVGNLDGAGVASRDDPKHRSCAVSRGVTECGPSAGEIPPDHPYYWASFNLVGEYR